MIKRMVLVFSLGCYLLAFLLNFVWPFYPYNWVFGVLGASATIASFWVKE